MNEKCEFQKSDPKKFVLKKKQTQCASIRLLVICMCLLRMLNFSSAYPINQLTKFDTGNDYLKLIGESEINPLTSKDEPVF